MDIASRIRKLGFRKWYERQLIESHLAFTTCFLCGIVVASCMEAISFAQFGWKAASLLALVLGATALGCFDDPLRGLVKNTMIIRLEANADFLLRHGMHLFNNFGNDTSADGQTAFTNGEL